MVEEAKVVLHEAENIDSQTHRSNIWRLTIAQALSGANSVVIYATGAIVGNILAPSPVLFQYLLLVWQLAYFQLEN